MSLDKITDAIRNLRREIDALPLSAVEEVLRDRVITDTKQSLAEMAFGPCDESNPHAVVSRGWARIEYVRRYGGI